ncbi:MAG: undecaprenyl-diphosphate phosphatase [Magnetococcales bacterium]|nr:undecaprenyl-diphosphate phosphatase [Magnetococcales bacterium]
MELLHALILAVIQGITEFLPISSSGHLILAPHLFGWPDQGLLFDIAANTGTLAAVILYFRHEFVGLVRGFFRSLAEKGVEGNPEGRLAWLIALATLPAGIVGLLFKEIIATYARNPLLIGANAIVFGLLMGLADYLGKRRRTLDQITWKDALLIGCAQAMALNPGTSRSGITITAGLFAGFDRGDAARFSFLMFIPIGIIAGIFGLMKLLGQTLSPEEWAFFGVGFVGSALTGFAVIHWLLTWLRSHSLMVFVVYRLLLAIAIFSLAR